MHYSKGDPLKKNRYIKFMTPVVSHPFPPTKTLPTLPGDTIH